MKQFITLLTKLPLWVYGIGLGALALLVTAGAGAKERYIDAADKPADLSIKDWRNALMETKDALKDKNINMIAAGISYFSSLAFFPLIAAAVAIAFLAITPEQIETLFTSLEGYLPPDVASLLSEQLSKQASSDKGNLLVAIGAILVSLFSASGAIDKLIKGLSIAYDTEETRGFVKLKLLSIALTLAGILIGFVIVGLLALNNSILGAVGIGGVTAWIILALRWVLLIVIISLVLAALFRYGPDRPTAKWQWVSWGAIAATILWLLGTIAFFVYVQYFANFTQSYSIFAGIIILMMWLNLSALIMLIGAQVNHRLETKTSRPKVLNFK